MIPILMQHNQSRIIGKFEDGVVTFIEPVTRDVFFSIFSAGARIDNEDMFMSEDGEVMIRKATILEFSWCGPSPEELLRRTIERVIWDAAIQCAADEADRAWIEEMSEEARLWHCQHAPVPGSPLGDRIRKLRDHTPPRSEWIGAPKSTNKVI